MNRMFSMMGTEETVVLESIDLSRYEGSRREKKDKAVRDKYPSATIHPLLAREKLTKGQRIFDNVFGIVTGAFGVPDAINDFKNIGNKYYLVEQGGKQFLVLITDEVIVAREFARNQNGEKFKIGNIKFTKCTYEVS